MQNKQFLLFFVMSMSALLFSYEAHAKKGGGGGRNRTDTTPSQFTFIDQSNVVLNTLFYSNTVTVSGINAPTAINVAGGEYAVNGGDFSSAATSVNNNDTVQLRVNSSSAYLTPSNASLTIGGVSDAFSVTTLDDPTDTTPDAFSFTDQVDVPRNGWVESNTITVSDITSATQISIVGGEYAVNGEAFSSSIPVNVDNGDNIQVRVNASADYSTVTDATLTIGGVSDTFSVLTESMPVIEPGSTGNPSFTSEHFSGSANCQMCHDGLTDDTGKDVSIIKAWKSTMMANATRDPLWKAKVRTELNRARLSLAGDSTAADALAGVINDKCSKCHAPMAHFEASKDNAPIEILDAGFTNANNAYHDRAMDGVSCTLCHQISDSPLLGTPEGMSGHYPIDSYANAVDRKIYGPYSNIFANPMRNNANYTPEYSAHVKESELCATCHNLKTPFTDGAGVVIPTTPEDEFPEQMPYSEWLASDYANPQSADQKSCQQCHMARSNGVVMATRPMWLDTQRDDFAQHIFVGGNKFMLDMLDNNKQELGVLANDFSEIIAGTENLLTNAASIELDVDGGAFQTTDALEFNLRINSNTGHKLPSAYPSRRVILHVTVKDSSGAIVFESGKVDADGSVVDLDSDMDQATYEPHYDLITSAGQVQVYEAIMQNTDNKVTYTLLRASAYVKDNRLLPAGFDKKSVSDDVKVAGVAVDDDDFIGGSDKITYRLAGLTGDDYTVTAELIYQTLAYGFAQDLFKDSSKEVSDFKRMYNASNAKVTSITTQTFVVTP